MSKASEYAEHMRAPRPEFRTENADVNACVTEDGDLWIGTPEGHLYINASHAVAFGRWVLETFEEVPTDAK